MHVHNMHTVTPDTDNSTVEHNDSAIDVMCLLNSLQILSCNTVTGKKTDDCFDDVEVVRGSITLQHWSTTHQ